MALSAQRATTFVDVPSDLFGTLTVPEDAVLDFTTGMYGFEACRHFIMVEAQLPGFFWLQSTEQSSLLFLLVDPFTQVDGYDVELDAPTTQELGGADPEDVSLLTVVTLPANAEQEATMNLQGPIVINMATRRAKQLVLPDDRWGCRHALSLEARPRGA